MTKTTRTGLNVKGGIKAGGVSAINHNVSGLKVRAGVKAGGLSGSKFICANWH